jgi:hypothetical protein
VARNSSRDTAAKETGTSPEPSATDDYHVCVDLVRHVEDRGRRLFLDEMANVFKATLLEDVLSEAETVARTRERIDVALVLAGQLAAVGFKADRDAVEPNDSSA